MGTTLLSSVIHGFLWSLGDLNLPRQSCAVNVKRQIRTSNREVEEPHGWSLFKFPECLIQDLPPHPLIHRF